MSAAAAAGGPTARGGWIGATRRRRARGRRPSGRGGPGLGGLEGAHGHRQRLHRQRAQSASPPPDHGEHGRPSSQSAGSASAAAASAGSRRRRRPGRRGWGRTRRPARAGPAAGARRRRCPRAGPGRSPGCRGRRAGPGLRRRRRRTSRLAREATGARGVGRGLVDLDVESPQVSEAGVGAVGRCGPRGAEGDAVRRRPAPRPPPGLARHHHGAVAGCCEQSVGRALAEVLRRRDQDRGVRVEGLVLQRGGRAHDLDLDALVLQHLGQGPGAARAGVLRVVVGARARSAAEQRRRRAAQRGCRAR